MAMVALRLRSMVEEHRAYSRWHRILIVESE